MTDKIPTSNRIARPLLTVAAMTGLLLLVPLAAMQITDEVRWGPGDFLVAGCLLFGTGAGLVVISRSVKRRAHRVSLMAAVLLVLAVVWAELAVGIFN